MFCYVVTCVLPYPFISFCYQKFVSTWMKVTWRYPHILLVLCCCCCCFLENRKSHPYKVSLNLGSFKNRLSPGFIAAPFAAENSFHHTWKTAEFLSAVHLTPHVLLYIFPSPFKEELEQPFNSTSLPSNPSSGCTRGRLPTAIDILRKSWAT